MYHNSYRYNCGFGTPSFDQLRTEYNIKPSRTSTTNEFIEKESTILFVTKWIR